MTEAVFFLSIPGPEIRHRSRPPHPQEGRADQEQEAPRTEEHQGGAGHLQEETREEVVQSVGDETGGDDAQRAGSQEAQGQIRGSV